MNLRDIDILSLYLFHALRYAACSVLSRLPRNAPAWLDRSERVARAVRGVLHARRPARRVSPLSARAAERQPSQVDERDAGARPRSGHVSGLPAFHHRCAVVGRRRVAAPARDHSRSHGRAHSRWHELSQAGAALGRRGATVLRRARQDRQLPDGGDGGVVDRRPRVDARRHVVPARRVADARAAHARPHSRLGPRAAQVAARADVAAAGAGERDPRDRRAGRCGVRRECHAAAGVAPRAAPVCLGGVVHAHDLRRHAGPRRPGSARPHRSSAIASHPRPRGLGARGPHLGRGPARARVAPRVVAQRHPTGVAGPVLCDARHARARLARASSRPGGLAALRTRPRRERSDQVPISCTCRPRRRCAPWCD